MNLSARVVTNMSVSIRLNESSSLIRYMNIRKCMNLLMSWSGSKNMNLNENCVCVRVWMSLYVR